MDHNLTLIIICGLFLYVTSAPMKTDDNVEHLMSIMKHLKSLDSRPMKNIQWYNQPLQRLGMDSKQKNNVVTSGGKNSGNLYRSFSSELDTPSKRQGSWSYDYGLGGGRFGKRSYDDYGIGGGRFGRDVDHVDLADGVLDGE